MSFIIGLTLFLMVTNKNEINTLKLLNIYRTVNTTNLVTKEIARVNKWLGHNVDFF